MMNKRQIQLFAGVLVAATLFSGCGSMEQAILDRYKEEIGYYDVWEEFNEDGRYDRESEKTGVTDTNREDAVDVPGKPGAVLDEDNRIPNFIATGYNYKTVTYKWQSRSWSSEWTWDLPIWQELYHYYSELGRYYKPSEFYHYTNDVENAALCKSVAESIVNTAMEKGLSKREAIFEVVAFVQSITYESDLNQNGQSCEYPKYPVETLMEGGGDCEDTSILLATMIKELGYGVALLHFEGHMMVGIAGGESETGAYYQKDGVNYFVLETTNTGWGMGDIPDNYKGEPAYVYVLN